MLDPKSTTLVLALADQLMGHGSWCGETHLQKAMFFLAKQCGVPVDYEFVLYKHGPYSFDFHDTLSTLFAHCLIENVAQPPYGPRIHLSASGKEFIAKHNDQIADVQDKIASVATGLGSKGVMELEKLATALWVRQEDPSAQESELAMRINEIKPHISVVDATEALKAQAKLTN